MNVRFICKQCISPTSSFFPVECPFKLATKEALPENYGILFDEALAENSLMSFCSDVSTLNMLF